MSDTALAPDAPVQDAPPPAADPAPAQDTVEPATQPPRPVESQPKEPEADEPAQEPEKKRVSTRDAVAKATEKVEAEARKAEEADKKEADDAKAQQEKADKDAAAQSDQKRQSQQAEGQEPEPGADEKAAQQRSPDGRFAADEHPDAPDRFTNDAKAEWSKLPPTTRSEVHRAVNELTRGLEDAERRASSYESIKEFDELAQKQGTTLRNAMHNYVSIELMLRKNPIEGLERICANLGTTLHDVASHVLGRQPDQTRSQQEQVISSLQKELNNLRYEMHGLQGITQQNQQERQSQQIMDQISEFAAQPGHERMEELSEQIAYFIESGKSDSLEDAYARAVRLVPAPSNGGSNPPPATPDGSNPSSRSARSEAQTLDKGALSVSGAPGRGSDPDGKRPPSSSARDAVRRAMARVG